MENPFDTLPLEIKEEVANALGRLSPSSLGALAQTSLEWKNVIYSMDSYYQWKFCGLSQIKAFRMAERATRDSTIRQNAQRFGRRGSLAVFSMAGTYLFCLWIGNNARSFVEAWKDFSQRDSLYGKLTYLSDSAWGKMACSAGIRLFTKISGIFNKLFVIFIFSAGWGIFLCFDVFFAKLAQMVRLVRGKKGSGFGDRLTGVLFLLFLFSLPDIAGMYTAYCRWKSRMSRCKFNPDTGLIEITD